MRVEIVIRENTATWKIVQQVATEEHISPEEAAERIYGTSAEA